MSEISPHEKLERKLDEYKAQLVNLKNKIDKSSVALKSDFEADLNSIEKMLNNVKKQIFQLEDIEEDNWSKAKDKIKHSWNDISTVLKNEVSKSSKH